VRKSLLIALIFAACGLVFLAVMGYIYYDSSETVRGAAAQWSNAEQLQADLLNRQNELTASGFVATPKGAPDIPTIVGLLRKDCNIDETNIRYTTRGGTKAGQGERYSVAIDKLSLVDLGKFLSKMRATYPYLKVSEVQATLVTASSGNYKWSLTVESMTPGKETGGPAVAGPGETPGAAEAPPSSGTSAEAAEAPASAGASGPAAESATAPLSSSAASGVKAKP
jgi:hypothetical protein